MQVAQRSRVATLDRATTLLSFIAPLLADEAGAAPLDDEDLAEEQALVAAALHSLGPASGGGGGAATAAAAVAETFSMLRLARERLAAGGPRRLRHTYPALVFRTLALVREAAAVEAAAAAAAAPGPSGEADGGGAPPAGASGAAAVAAGGEASCERMLQWALSICHEVAEASEPGVALRLMLAAGLAASEEAGSELLAYELFEAAFTLLEEALADSRARAAALLCVIGALQRCRVFGADNREALASAATGHAARLLKRADQCRAMCACATLWWQAPDAPPTAAGGAAAAAAPARRGRQPPVRDGARVRAVLARALKVATAAKQQAAAAARPGDAGHVALQLEVLQCYLCLLAGGGDAVTPAVVQPLLELAAQEVAAAGPGLDADCARAWRATVRHVRSMASGGGGGGGDGGGDAGLQQRFAALTIASSAP